MLPALTHLPKEHFSITLGWMNGTEEAIGQPSFNESRRRSLSAKREMITQTSNTAAADRSRTLQPEKLE